MRSVIPKIAIPRNCGRIPKVLKRDPKGTETRSKKYQSAIQKVLKCDPKSTKMRSQKILKCDPKEH